MSMRCEDVRPLLAELVYEEVEAELAETLREHLGTCLSCRRHHMVFMAVRNDLQEWQPAEESVPQGMTFIAPGAHGAAPIWQSRIFQGLAAAAGFMFIAVLTAAAVNVQVQSGPDGWAVSTTLGQPQPLEPPPVSLQQIRDLDTWFNTSLDNQLGSLLADRGVVTLASMPPQEFLTDGQVQQMTRRVTDMLNTSLAERDLEIDARYDAKFENMQLYVDGSLDQQSNVFYYTVANLVDSMQADHQDQIFEISQRFGNLSFDTDRNLAQANYRIDNLEMSLAAASQSRSPEQ
jgi:hypothetical protein